MKEVLTTISNTVSSKNITNFYIANSILVNIKEGSVRIKNHKNQDEFILTKGLYFIKKDIFVGIIGLQYNTDLSFDIIDIPADVLAMFCRENNDVAENRGEWIKKSREIPYCNELIRTIEGSMRKQPPFLQKNKGIITTNCSNKNTDYLIRYMLSSFIVDGKLPYILFSSSELTLSEKVYDIIYSETERNWSLGDMAKKLYLSQSTLKRKLHSEGTSFSAISILSKMNKAAKMLRIDDRKIQLIAEACGFNNASHFTTSFKKIFNVPPKKYRNMFRK
ncbi:TPA: helix-turn-helix domain-containing protein, partial [Escherichia coli]|nr:helix-turn-helix domain-containing protein [Escherichia coli]